MVINLNSLINLASAHSQEKKLQIYQSTIYDCKNGRSQALPKPTGMSNIAIAEITTINDIFTI